MRIHLYAMSLIVLALGACVSAHALAILNLHEYGTTNEYAAVTPGSTVHLQVLLTLTEDDLDALRYDLVMPDQSWVMTGREYGDYGWLVNDGFLDACVPKETATFPVTIDNALYAGPADTPDFHFETGQEYLSPLTPGSYVVEDFTLQVPLSFGATQYMNMHNLYAYEPQQGSPIDTQVGTEAFEFRYSSGDIPEPGTLALMILGLGAVAFLRRRRG